MDQSSPPAKDVSNNIKKINGIDFKEGSRLEARDHLGDKWWEAKVVEVDHDGGEVLVHFQGWNGRHDEWIKMDSPRLQPLHRRSRRFSTGPVTETPAGPSSSSGPPPPPVSASPTLYTAGEEVLALWKQNRKFPAIIQTIQEDGGYLVKFYDGFEKVVKGQGIRRIGKADLEFVKQCKDEIVAVNGDKEESVEDKNEEHENGDSSGPGKLRRERKSKFNVREILNLNPTKKISSTTPTRENKESLNHKVRNGDDVKINSKELSSDDLVDLNDSSDVKSEKSVSETGSEGTPSEKENFNCELMVGKFRSKSKETATDKMAVDASGKRERKRKRFADEEPELPALKSSKKSNTPVLKSSKSSGKMSAKTDHCFNAQNVLSQQVGKNNKKSSSTEMNNSNKKTKSRDKSKSESVENGSQEPKTSSSSLPLTSRSGSGDVKSGKSRDRTFPYLSFDFSLPQEKLVANLVEGVTIPGPKKPLLIKSTKLPTGWTKKVILRGVNQLKWEVIIENTLGKSFKSRAELIRYFEEQKFEGNMDHFDFALDTTLKKIRQIWRTNLNNSSEVKPLSNGVKEESPDTSFSDIESRVPALVVNNKASHPINKSKTSKSSDKSPPASSPSSPDNSLSINTTSPAASTTPVSSSAVSPTSALIIKGNASETGQGVRCPIKTCNKLFRNDKLLQMHVKHYHPEYAPGDSPTVTSLAAHRSQSEQGVTNGVDIKSPDHSQSHDEPFKVPDTKTLLSPVETLSESVGDKVDTEAATDGGHETLEDSEMMETESEKLVETPKISKTRPRRLRTESLMSASSDQVFTPPASPLDHLNHSLTLKRSKKGSAPSTPPGELKDGIETMSEGEVVHCTCINTEGDGMMVQCDSCLTWQHGACLGIDSDDQVPERYICSICTCPPLARQSSLYNLDMDWIREGRLSSIDQEDVTAPDSRDAESQLKTLSSLMTDLVNLSSVLHSLKCKLLVAKHKNNPKVFMWSNVWEESACTVTESPDYIVNENVNNIDNDTEVYSTFETVPEEESVKVADESFDVVRDTKENETKVAGLVNGDIELCQQDDITMKEELTTQQTEQNEVKHEEDDCENKKPEEDDDDKKEPKENDDDNIKPVKPSPDAEKKPEVNGEVSNSPKEEDALDEDETKMEVDENNVKNEERIEKENGVQHLEPENGDKQTLPGNFGSQLTEYFATEEGFDLHNLLPSVSEMQRMLPDVIKDISGGLASNPSPFQPPPVIPAPNFIPEPKRLDREECRQNLLVHIESLQKHVEERLEAVEEAVEDIERKRKESSGVMSGLMVSVKMQDVKSAKIVNDSLPEKI